MAWDQSRCIVFNWPDLFGYHMNITEADLTEAAEMVRVYPSSPENVWAGDAGVPASLHIPQDDGTYIAIDNTANAVPFSTVFLLFVDEAEAQKCLPLLYRTPE